EVGHHDFGVQGTAAVDHHHGADHAIVGDRARLQGLVGGDRAQGGLHGQLADHGVVVDSDVVADDTAGVNDHAAADGTVGADHGVVVDDAVIPQLRTSADLCRW